MCKHYTPTHLQLCDDDRVEPPVNKENANFCEYFNPSDKAFEPASDHQKETAISKLADLFSEDSNNEITNNTDESKSGTNQRSRLDDLFED